MVLWKLLNLRHRGVWISSAVVTLTLAAILGVDARFVFRAGLAWLLSLVILIVAGLAVGVVSGAFNRKASVQELAGFAVVPPSLIFLAALAFYMFALITTSPSECDPAIGADRCVDEHGASIGGAIALAGASVLAALLWLGALAGREISRRWGSLTH